MDTKVIVWGGAPRGKHFRHFSHWDDNGTMWTFIDGLTSWSGSEGTCSWQDYEFPWIEHDGGPQPFPDNVMIEVAFRDGVHSEYTCGGVDWYHDGGDSDVMKYRIHVEV